MFEPSLFHISWFFELLPAYYMFMATCFAYLTHWSMEYVLILKLIFDYELLT